MAYILCIETSTDICSVCIAADGEQLAIRETERSFSHSEVITVFIKECLEEAGVLMEQLAAVAVTSGPGSYTALRIGSSTAKGICYAQDIPLIAVDTIKSLAKGVHRHMNEGDTVIPLLDARRMEVYCAVYDQLLTEIEIVAPVILDSSSFEQYRSTGKIHYCGDGMKKAKVLLLSENAVFHEHEATATYLVDEAFAKFRANQFENLVDYTPFYFKGPNITVQKKNIL